MNNLNCLLVILCLSIISSAFGQNERREQIDNEIAKALKEEQYQLAADLKKEKNLLIKIDSAVAAENYQLAAELKKEAEQLRSSGSTNTPQPHKEATYNFSTTIPSTGIVPPSPGKAVVYFVFMESKYLQRKYELFDNDQYIGYLTGNKYIRYECDPGAKLFWISSENKEFLTAELLPGKVYLVKGKLNKLSGFMVAHVAFRLVDHKDPKDVKKTLKNVVGLESFYFEKEHIISENEKFEGFISKNLERYRLEWKGKYNFRHLASDMFYEN